MRVERVAAPDPILPEVIAIVPRLEPYLVEVVVWYPFGAADEAVTAAAATVEALLAQPDLGAALATSPPADDDSPRVATTEMVQAVVRQALAAAGTDAARIVQAAIADLLTTPNTLRALLPTEPPDEAGRPWLDGGVLAITPEA